MPQRSLPFRPRFTLLIVYVAGFFFFYAMLFALPALLEAYRGLEASSGPLTPEEMERAKQASQQALGGGRVLVSLLASIVTTGIFLWRRALPGLRVD